jgi:hypothetical protein
MVESDANNQQKRKSRDTGRWPEFGKLVTTFGLGAILTGAFGLGNTLITGAQKEEEERCSSARQIVIDDSASPALSQEERRRLGLLAMRVLQRCLGDEL